VGTNQFRALFTGGAGVKFRVTDHVLVRADFAITSRRSRRI